MKKRIRIMTLVLAMLLAVLATTGALAETGNADKTLYYNGTFYTNDAANPSADAVVVEDGKFAFVGTYDEALTFAGNGCSQVDLNGQFVTPGFFDAHIHMAAQAVMGPFDFRDYIPGDKPTVEDYARVLKEYLKAHPDIEYLRGTGWQNASFDVDGPTKDTLDAINAEIPIAIRSLDGHSLWANSKAIEQAGITPETQVPGGMGTIVLNAEGEVSGTFREPAALDMVLAKFPPPSVDEYKTSILKTQKTLLSFGVTGVHDALVPVDSPWYHAYRELERDDELRLHLSIAFQVTPENYEAQLEWVVSELAKYKDVPDQKITMSACKFFADGVLEGGTAYLKGDYANQHDYHGIAIWEKDEMAKAFKICDENGIRIHTHAIGDAAITMTLDCMEGLSTDHRNALAHIQLIDDADVMRFQEMGVVAIVAPFWAFNSDETVGSDLRYLGEERADKVYTIKTFIENGIHTAAHSDYPVSPEYSPLIGIETAITRQRPVSQQTDAATLYEPLNIEQAITAEQAIDVFTYQGAYSCFMEDITGSITVGKSADFAVIDNNILETPSSLATVTATYFEGEMAFEK